MSPALVVSLLLVVVAAWIRLLIENRRQRTALATVETEGDRVAAPPATAAGDPLAGARAVMSRFYDLIRDAPAPAEHCEGWNSCVGGTVCACRCRRCTLRRALLTQAQIDLHARVEQVPGESPGAWALRAGRPSPVPDLPRRPAATDPAPLRSPPAPRAARPPPP